MKLGIVLSQLSPDRFVFSQDDADSVVLPGDYVSVSGNGGEATIAVVEEFSGLSRGDDSDRPTYRCSCRVLKSVAPRGLVGNAVLLASSDQLTLVFSATAQACLGEIACRTDRIPFHIDLTKMQGRHSCFFGASGSGKSTLLGLLLEEMLLSGQGGQIIILDPNSDFSRLGSPKTIAEVNSPNNACSRLAESEISLAQSRLASVTKVFCATPKILMDRFTTGEFLATFAPEQEIEMYETLHATVSELKRQRVPVTVDACLGRVAAIRGTSNSLIEDGAAKCSGTLVAILRRVTEAGIWSSVQEDSLNVLSNVSMPSLVQYDLGGLHAQPRSLFAESLFRALWERNEKSRIATYIVIDEAHNLVPQNPREIWDRRTSEWINRIAGEGRKYGLFLVVVSQRPSKIHSNTLDNCRNFFISRLENRDDLASLAIRTGEVSEMLLSRVAGFRKHEALIYGDVCSPAIIRVGRRKSL